MPLPIRTALVARLCDGHWPLINEVELVQADLRWLRFAIARALLPRHKLQAAWQVQGQQPWPRQDRQVSCQVARRRRRGKRPRIVQPATDAEGNPRESADSVHGLPLPPWLLGGVFRWRKDRWAYAPRQFSRTWRAIAWVEAEQYEAGLAEQEEQQASAIAAGQEPPADEYDPQERDARWREARAFADPYVDVHRLLQSLKDEFQDRRLACHFGCVQVTAPRRARCLEEQHLTWGNHQDNAYHAHMHDRHLAAERHTPIGFLFPSQQPDYDSHNP